MIIKILGFKKNNKQKNKNKELLINEIFMWLMFLNFKDTK